MGFVQLEERWPLAERAGLRDRLLAAWSAPSRAYHDTVHLAEVLDRLDELAGAGVSFPRLPVVLAAWFHDGVYDGRPDAEERSARWAEQALPDAVDASTVAEVARLVRLTATHRPAAGDTAGQALCDADLAILAAPAPRYAAYVADVRREYAHLRDDDFAVGRGRRPARPAGCARPVRHGVRAGPLGGRRPRQRRRGAGRADRSTADGPNGAIRHDPTRANSARTVS